jgi:hypothetical protein
MWSVYDSMAISAVSRVTAQSDAVVTRSPLSGTIFATTRGFCLMTQRPELFGKPSHLFLLGVISLFWSMIQAALHIERQTPDKARLSDVIFGRRGVRFMAFLQH